MKLRVGRYISFLITLTIGVIISFLLYQVEYSRQQQNEIERFNQLVKERFIAIETKLDRSFASVKSLHAFFSASEFVSRDKFKAYSLALLQAYPEVQALEWIPLVTLSERINYEEGVKKEGFPQFSIREKNDNKQLIPAQTRAIYYPVHYVEPIEGNEKALGYDLGSNKVRLRALELAASRHMMVITEPIILVQESQQQQAILILEPFFEKSFVVEAQQQPSTLLGYVLMVMKMDDFYYYTITSTFNKEGVHVEIIDKQTNQWITGDKNVQHKESQQHNKELQIEVGGRQWQLAASAAIGFPENKTNRQAIYAFILSLLLSVFFAFYVHNIKRKTSLIRQQVIIKTKELRKTQALYKTIINTAPDAIISIDGNGVISEFNQSAEKLLGYDRKEVIGENVKVIMPSPYTEEHDGYISHFKKTGEGNIIGQGREVIALHKNGKHIIIYLTVADTNTPGNHRFTGILHDLTAAKEAEKVVRVSQAKSEFLANMSHELRTPMHGILSFSSFGMSRLETASQEKLGHYFQRINESAHRLLHLLNDLLDLAKLEAGKMVFDFNISDLRHILDSCIDEQSARMETLNLATHVEITDSTNTVCDAIRIGQVITNLLSNAIKFSPENTFIKITVQSEYLTLATGKKVAGIKLTVANKGVDIPENELNTIFDKFVQSSKTNTGAGGTGLGLSICYEVIKGHQGKIWAENAVDGGAMFHFIIPVEAMTPMIANGNTPDTH